jgi:hypothetical protein
MNPTIILGTILILVLLYGIFNLLFVKYDPVMEIPLNSTHTMPGNDITEIENKKYSDYTHSFFIYLIDQPDSSIAADVDGYKLVERSSVSGNEKFQIYLNNDATKLIARAWNGTDYNGVQHIGLNYQKHIFVTVVVKRNTIDLYLDGQLVNASVFTETNKANFYNTDITLSSTHFQKGSTNKGFMHSYEYTDRALTAEEIVVLYNSYVSAYNRNSTSDYSAKLSLTRNGEELTDIAKKFTF